MIAQVRSKIIEILQEALEDGDIAYILDDPITVNPLTTNLPKYPAACLESPSFESERADNQSNQRTYLFPITFIMRTQDVKNPADADVFKEKIANRFDRNFDLQGIDGGQFIEPAVSPSEIFPADFGDLIIFTVEISVVVLVDVAQ